MIEWSLHLSIQKQGGNSNNEHLFTSKDGSDTILNAVHEEYVLTFYRLHGLDVIHTPISQFQKSKQAENLLLSKSQS